MPVLIEEQVASSSAKAKDKVRAQAATDPLAGKELQCPYCGWAYLPEEGCFCVRVVGWDGKPLGQ
jgi:hypothetical protein